MVRSWLGRLVLVFLIVGLLLPCGALGELAEDDEDAVLVEETAAEETDGTDEVRTARDDLIDRILALGERLYVKANGKAQRAHYKSDIYVCKNFTTYLFNQNKADFRMAEFPGVKLVIPNNLPSAKCKPYYYGYCWQDVPAKKGNPFYIAAQFLYDSKLS